MQINNYYYLKTKQKGPATLLKNRSCTCAIKNDYAMDINHHPIGRHSKENVNVKCNIVIKTKIFKDNNANE